MIKYEESSVYMAVYNIKFSPNSLSITRLMQAELFASNLKSNIVVTS